MLNIYLRAKARLPVVLMGETGCGKTSLIRFLCTYVLDDYFELFNMHAGISENEIVDRVQKFTKVCQLNSTKDCWLVFDEFNTSDSYGIIKTVMIDRKLNGNPLPVNAVFVGTCNPFKLKNKQTIDEECIGLKRNLMFGKNNQYRLLYTVNPIPDSLIFYTFNFGQLSEKDEGLYIETLLRSVISESYHEPLTKCIIEAHKYIKESLDLSATSLRDLRRFQIIHDFFKNVYFPARYSKQDVKEYEEKMIVLTFMVCYYFRLSKQSERDKILQFLTNFFKHDVDLMKDWLKEEYDYLLNEMHLENNIVKNNALSENLFCMFVCLLNKVPLIIIGKPGSSKSLALQLIFSRLKGKSSAYDFFRNFDELAMVSYQGSEYSTSESIEKIFLKAENSIQSSVNEQSQRIPVIVFDEIGLAELSKNNPLKVLHAKLELENIKVGFVGISNWNLDSSKMNRVLTVARRDPNLSELEETATIMALDVSNAHPKIFQECFKTMARVYLDLKEDIKREAKDDIFGLRDFYFMIKYVVNEFASLEDLKKKSAIDIKRRLYKSVMTSIMRNFSYDKDYFIRMWDNFKSKIESDTIDEMHLEAIRTDELLISNLNDPKSRFMMIITDHSEVRFKVYNILKTGLGINKNRHSKIIIGSKFEDDINSEDYCVDIVSEIIMYMEQDIVLILQQLDKIYTSLYDLFDQNFRKYGNQNYCRIVQGTISKSFHLVHNSFKVVLFMTKNELKHADEPLINRFEKYSLSKDTFIIEEHKKKILKLTRHMALLFGKDVQNLKSIRRVIPNYTEASKINWISRIERIMMDFKADNQKKQDDEEDVKDLFLEAFMVLLKQIASLNFCVYLYNSNKFQHCEEYLNEFLESKKSVLFHFMSEKLNFKTSTLSIIYTFSSMFESIQDRFNANEETKYFLKEHGIVELTLQVFKTEKDFKRDLKNFFVDQAKRFLAIKLFGKTEQKHMYYLQCTISNLLSDYDESNKHCMIIVYYKQEHIAECDTFPLSSDWCDYSIDLLFNPLDNHAKALVLKPDLNNAIENFKEPILQKFDEIVDRTFEELVFEVEKKDVLEQTIEYFSNFTKKYPKEIVEMLLDLSIKACKTDPTLANCKTVFDLMKKRNDYQLSSDGVVQGIKSSVFKLISSKIGKLFKILKNEMLIYSLYNYSVNNDKDLLRFWKEIVGRTITPDKINSPIPPTDQGFPLCYPYSHREFASIEEFKISEDLRKNPTSKFVKEIFHKFLEKEYYSVVGYNITEKSERELIMLVADLIYLHISRANNKSPDIKSLMLTMEGAFKGRMMNLYEMFVFDPKLISYVIIFFDNLRISLKDRATPIFAAMLKEINFDNESSITEFIYDFINKLFAKIIECENLITFFEELSVQFYRICQYSGTIESQLDRLFTEFEAFELWNHVIKLVIEFPQKREMLLFIFDNYIGHPSEVVDNIQNLNKLMAIIREIPNQFANLPKFKVSMFYFEVFYYNVIVSKNNENNPEVVKEIYDRIFKKIEEEKEFYLSVNPLIIQITDYTELFSSLIQYLKDGGVMAQAGNAYFNWFAECIRRFPKRLPYQIIITLSNEIQKSVEKEEFLEIDAGFVSRLFEKFKNISSHENLTLENVFTIATIRYLLHYYANSFKTPRFLAVENHMRILLNEKKPITKSLQIYILKYLKKIEGCDFEALEAFFTAKNVKAEWIGEYFIEHKNQTTRKIENAECILVKNSEVFRLAYKHHDAILDSPNKSIQIAIETIEASKNKLGLMSYYSSIINQFYLNKNQMNTSIANYLNAFTTVKNRFLSLLGTVGYEFVLKILTNFDNDSALKISNNITPEKMRRNINILHAFAFLLSQKYENNHFSALLYKDGADLPDLPVHLSKIYLPGMIIPNNPQVSLMFSVLEVMKTDWSVEEKYPGYTEKKFLFQCKPDCNCFFYFQDCGQPNVVGERTCPFCGGLIGATKYGKEYSHHVRHSKDKGMEILENHIKTYKAGYSKGYFNPDLTILNLNDDNLNVDSKTINFLNFITNSLVLVLYNLRLYPDLMFSLVPVQNLQHNFESKISDNYKKFNTQYQTVDINILINAALTDILEAFPNIAPANTLESYYAFEKELETKVVRPFFNNSEIKKNEYKAAINELLKDPYVEPSIVSIIDEVTKECLARFPLLNHLRLSHEPIQLHTYITKFQLKSREEQSNFPITKFIIKNRDNLEKLQIITSFKEFYDKFYEKFSGKLSRQEAENCWTIDKYLQLNREFEVSGKRFIKQWNSYVSNDLTEQYQCERIKLSKIDVTSSLTTLLPSTYRDNRGNNVLFGLGKIIKFQNQMVELLKLDPNDGKSQLLGWKNVSKKTIFEFNEQDLEKEINDNCISSFCDYGDLGIAVIEFARFERRLVNRISKYNLFEDEVNFVPQFKYAFESDNFSGLLVNLKNTGYQQALNRLEVESFTKLLSRCNDRNNYNFYASMFSFLESILIPRAIFASAQNAEKSVVDFIKETTSSQILADSPLKNDFSELKMNQVYSFVLLIEELLFKHNFIDIKEPMTRLDTDLKSREWLDIKNNEYAKFAKCEIVEKNFDTIMNGLGRLTLRASYNNDPIDIDLMTYFSSETLFDLEFDYESIYNIKLPNEITLKQTFLVYKQMEVDQKRKRGTIDFIEQSGFGQIRDTLDNVQIFAPKKRQRANNY